MGNEFFAGQSPWAQQYLPHVDEMIRNLERPKGVNLAQWRAAITDLHDALKTVTNQRDSLADSAKELSRQVDAIAATAQEIAAQRDTIAAQRDEFGVIAEAWKQVVKVLMKHLEDTGHPLTKDQVLAIYAEKKTEAARVCEEDNKRQLQQQGLATKGG